MLPQIPQQQQTNETGSGNDPTASRTADAVGGPEPNSHRHRWCAGFALAGASLSLREPTAAGGEQHLR